MDAYTTHMSLYTADDVVMCRVFPAFLKEGALSWFTKLPPFSVNSFATLMYKSETQFATSHPHYLTSIALVSIRQEKGESLRTFVHRFSKVAMSIRQPTECLDKLRKRVAKYMQLKELREFRNQARAETGK